MMLVELRDARSKASLLVNPLQVRYVRRDQSGAVVIIFDSQTTVTVDDTLENVARLLGKAMPG